MGQALIVDAEGSKEEMGLLRPFKTGVVYSSTPETLPQTFGSCEMLN